MKIYFKNTLTGEIQTFKPLHRKKVGMYNCGPTVYNKAHIGNLSSYIFADVIRRLLEAQNYTVDQVINITDVGHLTDDGDNGEDKVEKKSKETGRTANDISEEYTRLFLEDLEKLNINTTRIVFPKATEHIEEQIELIKKLNEKGLVYKITDGMYFDTSKFKDYGKLGNINIEQLQEGARVEVNSEKKNPTDFALWKFSSPTEKRQQEWQSPWGIGFPGWHIECSAMSRKYLGETFDIHTGGIDHIPTHHNNEIAQSEGAYDKPLANYWLHFNHIMLNGEKISKSVGNVVYLDDFTKFSPAVFRYWFLTSHYSTQSNFTWDVIEANAKAVEKISNFIDNKTEGKVNKKYYKQALKELNHDLGTPEAIAVIWELMKDEKVKDEDKVATILKIDEILGVGFKEMPHNTPVLDIPTDVIQLAEKRLKARQNKDFETADVLRDEILEKGFVVKDVEGGYKIEVK